MNQKIIDQFEKLADIKRHEQEKLHLAGKAKEAQIYNFKIQSFEKVIGAIKMHKNDIHNSNDLKGVKGIGPKNLARVEEIVTKGSLTEITNLPPPSETEPTKLELEIKELEKITGCGYSHASKLAQKGVTLKHLLDEYHHVSHSRKPIKIENTKYLKELTHHQLIGVKYFNQIQNRIPRAEIAKIEVVLKGLVTKFNPKLMMVICGSYRRGKAESGDIDVLITCRESGTTSLKDLIVFLTKNGFLLDHLTEKGETKYMGICQGGYRIDIRFISYESYYPALLYFTGSKDFNIKMRGHALENGYTLEEYHLHKLLDPVKDKDQIAQNKKNSKVGHSHRHMKGQAVVCHSEEDIFKVLGMDYLDPTMR